MPSSNPGLTSTLNLAVGLISVQTEATTEPAEVTSIAVFRGRVVHEKTRSLADLRRELGTDDVLTCVKKAHHQFETGLHELLLNAMRAKRAAQTQVSEVAQMFMVAVDTYAGGDFASALEVIEALVSANRDSARLQKCLAGLRTALGRG
ncbi:MAG: hypothetical protein HY903_04490 [Deltaproteobacteria bacterium]|nr:hypothetical protein [Deltaproteobacteria bacterium]